MRSTPYDEVAVIRVLEGDKSILQGRHWRVVKVEVVRRAREKGWSYRKIEAVTGITKPERYLK